MEFYNERDIDVRIRKIALKEGAIPHGKRSELLEEFGLRGENLIKRIEGKNRCREKNRRALGFITSLLELEMVQDLELFDDQGVKVSTHTYDV
mgnify:CR=1 FL=1